MRCDECTDALGPYVDGELPPEEAEAVRAHLASCPQCAAEHEAMIELSRRLKGGLERSSAPDVLKARIRGALGQPDAFATPTPARETPWLRFAAAALVVAVASSGLTYALATRQAHASPVEQQVLASHIRSLMPGHLTDVASNDLHNVKPWFNGRVDLSPAVPRLDSAGFPLAGGRLDYVDGRPVATIVYMRRQHVINLFTWPATSSDAHVAPASTTERGYHLVRWSDGGTQYWAASDVSAPDLDRFVTLYRQAAEGTGNIPNAR